jgi:hypothetical protein
MTEMNLPFESPNPNTWVCQPWSQHVTRIAIRLEDDVLTFTTPVCELTQKQQVEHLRQLLVFNATELLHAAYGIQDNMIILSGSLAVANLDFNEFEAIIADISLAIDSHFKTINQEAA